LPFHVDLFLQLPKVRCPCDWDEASFPHEMWACHCALKLSQVLAVRSFSHTFHTAWLCLPCIGPTMFLYRVDPPFPVLVCIFYEVFRKRFIKENLNIYKSDSRGKWASMSPWTHG
jgi:hypothetical protein